MGCMFSHLIQWACEIYIVVHILQHRNWNLQSLIYQSKKAMKPQCGPRYLGPRHIHFAPQHSEGVPVSSEMEAAAVPPSGWSNDTRHIILQRKELEPLQMKVRMPYLHWMFLAFLFSMYQARGEGAGTSLFCSIPFKHTISGKRKTRSS